MGDGGALYERFELTLPRGSKLSPSGHRGLNLSTDRFSLKIEVEVTPFSGLISTAFADHYIQKPWISVAVRRVDIRVQGRVKFFAILRFGCWSYYDWLDSLRERLEEFGDFEGFLKRIGWTQIEAILHAQRVSPVSSPQRSARVRTPVKKPKPRAH
jgi:hypothetical protein